MRRNESARSRHDTIGAGPVTRVVRLRLGAARLRHQRGARLRAGAADGRRGEHRVRLLRAVRARQQLRRRRRFEGDAARLQVRVQRHRHERRRRRRRRGGRGHRSRRRRRGGLAERRVEAARGGGAVGRVVPARGRVRVPAHQRHLLRLARHRLLLVFYTGRAVRGKLSPKYYSPFKSGPVSIDRFVFSSSYCRRSNSFDFYKYFLIFHFNTFYSTDNYK